MRKLPLVLLITFLASTVLPAAEFCAPADCDASIRLGRLHARSARVSGWFWTGFSIAAVLFAFDVAAEATYGGYDDDVLVDVIGASLMIRNTVTASPLTPHIRTRRAVLRSPGLHEPRMGRNRGSP